MDKDFTEICYDIDLGPRNNMQCPCPHEVKAKMSQRYEGLKSGQQFYT